jgi:hypothetical protein
VIRGRTHCDPERDRHYLLFVDAASGSETDAMTWAIAHCEETADGRILVVVQRRGIADEPVGLGGHGGNGVCDRDQQQREPCDGALCVRPRRWRLHSATRPRTP